MLDESTFAASPYGVAERVKEKVSGLVGGNGDGDDKPRG